MEECNTKLIEVIANHTDGVAEILREAIYLGSIDGPLCDTEAFANNAALLDALHYAMVVDEIIKEEREK